MQAPQVQGILEQVQTSREAERARTQDSIEKQEVISSDGSGPNQRA